MWRWSRWTTRRCRACHIVTGRSITGGVTEATAVGATLCHCSACHAWPFRARGWRFWTMNASGADLLVAGNDKLQGYYENGGREGWSRFVAFPRGQRTTPTWRSPSLKLADCNGDGRIDALANMGPRHCTVANQSERGWAEPGDLQQRKRSPAWPTPLCIWPI